MYNTQVKCKMYFKIEFCKNMFEEHSIYYYFTNYYYLLVNIKSIKYMTKMVLELKIYKFY